MTCGNYFSVGNPTIKKKWLESISKHKKNYAFAIFDQFIVSLKAVFHFKHNVPTRIKTNFKFQNLVNVDWLILP